MVVRHASSEDAEFVKSVARELFLAYGSYERYVESWQREPDVVTQVAELDGARAGFSMATLHLEEAKKVVELLAIGVKRTCQSRGVGGALLDACIELGAEAEASEVRLSVAEGNSRAQRLFASRGFRLRQGVGVYPSGQRARFMARVTRQDHAHETQST